MQNPSLLQLLLSIELVNQMRCSLPSAPQRSEERQVAIIALHCLDRAV